MGINDATYFKVSCVHANRHLVLLSLGSNLPDYLNSMCDYRKYPYPHHRGNWKFQRGGRVNDYISSQRVNSAFMSDLFQVSQDSLVLLKQLTAIDGITYESHYWPLVSYDRKYNENSSPSQGGVIWVGEGEGGERRVLKLNYFATGTQRPTISSRWGQHGYSSV